MTFYTNLKILLHCILMDIQKEHFAHLIFFLYLHFWICKSSYWNNTMIYVLKRNLLYFYIYKIFWGNVPRSFGQSSLLWIKPIGTEVVSYVRAFNDPLSVIEKESWYGFRLTSLLSIQYEELKYFDWVIGWPKPLWMFLFYEMKCLFITQLDVVIHWLWNCIF